MFPARILSCGCILFFAMFLAADEAKKDEPKDKDEKIRSLVFLRKTHLPIQEKSLIAALKKVFPDRKVGSDDKDEVVVVVKEKMAVCMLEKEKIMLLINSLPKPYVPDREAMAKHADRVYGDKERSKAMREHKAWFSVDIFGEMLEEKDQKRHYELLSKIISQFHDDSCTLLYYPELKRAFAVNAATLKLLQAGKALELANDGVIHIDDDDPELKAAVSTARKRWNEFEKAFRDQKGMNHSIKYKFEDKKESEHMWVSVDAIERGMVIGKLANVPNSLTNIKEGDVVKCSIREIEDWLYVDGKKLVGGFSIEVLKKLQEKR